MHDSCDMDNPALPPEFHNSAFMEQSGIDNGWSVTHWLSGELRTCRKSPNVVHIANTVSIVVYLYSRCPGQRGSLCSGCLARTARDRRRTCLWRQHGKPGCDIKTGCSFSEASWHTSAFWWGFRYLLEVLTHPAVLLSVPNHHGESESDFGVSPNPVQPWNYHSNLAICLWSIGPDHRTPQRPSILRRQRMPQHHLRWWHRRHCHRYYRRHSPNSMAMEDLQTARRP